MHAEKPQEDRRPKREALPANIQTIVDEFLNHPDRKIELQAAVDVAKTFLSRIPLVGVLVALAEVEDRDLRLAMAKAIKQAVGRTNTSG